MALGLPPNRACRARRSNLRNSWPTSPSLPEGSVKACGWYLLATEGLHGAHLENALSAYQRASSRLTPAQIAEVEAFCGGLDGEDAGAGRTASSAGNPGGNPRM